MKYDHDSKRTRVREPVQVYLGPEDQERLDRLTTQLGATKSDVLRRGLDALERQVLDPAAHPALRLIGIAAPASEGPDYDPAREHDRFLADSEEASWSGDEA